MEHDPVQCDSSSCAGPFCVGSVPVESSPFYRDGAGVGSGPAATALRCAAPSYPPFLAGSCQRDWVNEMWAQADRGDVPPA